MTNDDIITLFDYGYWANRKLFAAMEKLTPAQFAQTVDGSVGCVRRTIVHMLNAEHIWLGRCGGPVREVPLDPAACKTVGPVMEAWALLERQMKAFLATLCDEDLSRQVEFTVGGKTQVSLTLGQVLLHATNHGSHHRGQLSLLLRLLGQEPDNFDLMLYWMTKQ